MNRRTRCCFGLLPLFLSAGMGLAQELGVHHPLDALTTPEYWTVHDVLFESGHLKDDSLVSSLLLHEPAKDVVLAWKPGTAVPREADVILTTTGVTAEARVDIAHRKLEFWKKLPGKQAPITASELDRMSDAAKADPRVVAALKEHGVTDLSSVRCEPIPITFVVFPEQKDHRIGYADCVDARGSYHAWGRAIPGLYIKADLGAGKIVDVVNHGTMPPAKGDTNYEEAAATPRENTKPLVVTQPEGASYRIENGEVAWQNWRFRFRLDPRVGPVLQEVKYKDGDSLRSMMYEGSLSEMYVPYMDPEEWWNSRAFLDAGEFLLGGLIKPLGSDDCPAHAQFFTGIVPSDKGAPVLEPQLACLFEHATDAPVWRHLENGLISGRPGRELVLRTAAVLGNYDYLLDWVFQQDGTIRVAVGATGIVETKAVAETDAGHAGHEGMKQEYGTLIAPHVVAVDHDHYFSFRLDFDVDGPNNSFMVQTLVPEAVPNAARKSIWVPQSAIAKREQDAILDLDLRKPSMWMFMNTNEHGAIGNAPGMEVMPEATGVSFVSPEDPAQKVGAFSEHQFWVTPYKPDELYASGVYVNSSEGLEGLPEWTKANRSIENTDIVGWYTLGFHHVVRQEDWPVMPTLWHDFLIRPVNFFEKNPALTLPHTP